MQLAGKKDGVDKKDIVKPPNMFWQLAGTVGAINQKSRTAKADGSYPYKTNMLK
ncbi:hypothetical protein C2W64_03009 [Brevibacillus laterosporus]|nr:hypothetical protein C2W64_03009 [Brevibacillus laterosporus]